MSPLTQKDLDMMPCGGCGRPVGTDTHAAHSKEERGWIHGRCHPSAGTRASYAKGVLRIECRKCGAFITNVAVAP